MKSLYKRIFSFYCLLLLGQGQLIGQVNINQIDSLAQLALETFEIAGMSVGVVKDNKVIYAKGHGFKNNDTRELVDEHTNFAIGSNSKAFTTAALALLVEEGKLDWNDKVKSIIPEFRMYDPYVEQHFTVVDLLTHRSGLGLGVGDLMLFPDGSDFTIDDILTSFQHFEPVSEFRTQFDYDNLLYFVAGEVVARISGIPFDNFLQTKIIDPLNMDHSYSSLSKAAMNKNLSSAHAQSKEGIKVVSHFEDMINAAAGGIYSNVDDMAQWILLQLNEGRYGVGEKDTLFTKASQDEMWDIYTVMETRKGGRYNRHFLGYGLGWIVSDIDGMLKVEHTGGLPGMLSKVVMIPELELGIVVLTNTSDSGAGVFESVCNSIIDLYLEKESNEWIEKYAGYFSSSAEEADSVTQSVWSEIETKSSNSFTEEMFIGSYEDPWFGIIKIYKNDKELSIQCVRSPKLVGTMHFYKELTFAVKWDYQDMNCDAFANFEIDEKGKVVGLKMEGISPNIDFSFDFHDLELKKLDK